MNIIDNPKNFLTNDQQWWAIFESETKKIIVPPNQCSGYTSSPFTMIVSDNKEELDQYILENELYSSID
jgi:hypothetical protein